MRKAFLCLPLLALSVLPAHALEQGTPVQLVQSSNADYQISVMEEQIRQLNGKIEELNFQLLEMQERMRRMQEDNDFRFQQIEEKQGSLKSNGNETAAADDDDGFIRLEKSEPSEQETASSSDGVNQQSSQARRTIDGVEIYDGESGIDQNSSGTLGSIQFDENGNIIGSQIGEPLDLMAGLNDGGSANPLPSNPDELFSMGYDNVQAGRYEDGEVALVAFSQQFEGHPKLPEARFWLGESYLGRGQYKSAAETYLDAHKRWPNAKYGPQALMKLGVSVAGLNQRELACATFAEVLQKYPQASRAVRRAVAFEQRAAQCAMN
jgi:tol-pal system protein YbgF